MTTIPPLSHAVLWAGASVGGDTKSQKETQGGKWVQVEVSTTFRNNNDPTYARWRPYNGCAPGSFGGSCARLRVGIAAAAVATAVCRARLWSGACRVRRLCGAPPEDCSLDSTAKTLCIGKDTVARSSAPAWIAHISAITSASTTWFFITASASFTFRRCFTEVGVVERVIGLRAFRLPSGATPDTVSDPGPF